MDLVEKTAYLIKNNFLMVMSTADKSGKPWVSPVAFTYDDSCNLYWVSNKDALHSNNIRSREEIAITIYGKMPDGSFDGIYFDAKATELSKESDINFGIQSFVTKRPQPAHFAVNSVRDVTGSAAWRIYKAVPQEIYIRANGKSNGQAITIRERVQFNSLHLTLS